MIRDYATFMGYFGAIAGMMPEIKRFIPGPLDRVISEERISAEHPIFRVQDPAIHADSEHTIYDSSFMVVHHADENNWTQQDLIINRMYHIALQVKARMLFDVDEGEFELDANALDPITGMTHANDYGWRMSFTLSVPRSLCLPDCSALNGQITLPFFEYSISDNTLNMKLSHDNWQHIQFTDWNEGELISGLVPQGPTYEASVNIGNFPDLFLVKMTLDSGEIASSLVVKSVPCGFSVPYLIS